METVIYLALAAFIISRLYNSLGKFGDTYSPKPKDTKNSMDQTKTVDSSEVIDISDIKLSSDLVQDEVFKTILEIKKADNNFKLKEVIYGAEMAFEMILKAFANHDTKVIEKLTTPELTKQFIKKIEQSPDSIERYQKEIISIKSTLQSLSLNKKTVKISIIFDSEQTLFDTQNADDNNEKSNTVTKLKSGKDTWSFQKDISSSDPVWYLCEILN